MTRTAHTTLSSALFTAVAALAPLTAAAQDQPDSWSLKADLGLSVIRGTAKTSTVSASTLARHRDGKHTWTVTGDFRRFTADSTVTVNRGKARISYRYQWGERSYYSVRFEGAYNRPAGLRARVIPATSVGYRVANSDGLEITVEGGGRVIRDRFVDGTRDQGVYLSASEELTYELADDTKLHQLLDVTPRTGDPGDLLYTGRVRLLTEVTEEVGLEVSVEDEFESRPFVDPATGEPKSEHEVSFFRELSFRL